MLLDMLVLLDSILQMQLFQINQSEDSSKLTILSDTTCSQLHQRPFTTASLYHWQQCGGGVTDLHNAVSGAGTATGSPARLLRTCVAVAYFSYAQHLQRINKYLSVDGF